MRVLALDTSTGACSVAIAESGKSGNVIIAREYEELDRGHSEVIAPMVAKVLEKAKLNVQDMDAIAVTRGPGSFTGVRIGLSMAMGLALSSGIPVIGISTLHAVAYQGNKLKGRHSYVLAIMDTKGSDLYVQAFDPDLVPLDGPKLLRAEDLLDILKLIPKNIDMIVLGDAVSRIKSILVGVRGDIYIVEGATFPDAVCVGKMALSEPLPPVGALKPRPIYLRPSYAKVPPGGGRLRP